MGSNQLYKGSLATIILKLLEEKGRMYDYQITQEAQYLYIYFRWYNTRHPNLSELGGTLQTILIY